ncbi:hypothetical protein FJ366_01790 [Candidatus Dependentiae bacterium]|nr:hypothetical protein [Candidatus Dependentiae bacterium]
MKPFILSLASILLCATTALQSFYPPQGSLPLASRAILRSTPHGHEFLFTRQEDHSFEMAISHDFLKEGKFHHPYCFKCETYLACGECGWTEITEEIPTPKPRRDTENGENE